MKIIAIASQKGGTGKTTTTAALAQAAVADGQKVLAIDMDPQGSLTHIVGADGNQPGIYEILKGNAFADCIQPIGHGQPDTIPPGKSLAAIERDAEIVQHPAPSAILSTAMRPLDSYDLVLVDTPPALGLLLFNALTAATDVLIPLQADTFALQGIYQLHQTITQVRQHTNPTLTVAAVLTRFSPRTNIARDLQRVISDKCRELHIPLLSTQVREGVAVREAQAIRQSLYNYAPNSNPAQDYRALYAELRE